MIKRHRSICICNNNNSTNVIVSHKAKLYFIYRGVNEKGKVLFHSKNKWEIASIRRINSLKSDNLNDDREFSFVHTSTPK